MSQLSKFSQIVAFSKKYPLSRGVASYACIWPFGSIVQQLLAGEEKLDFIKVARFCLYGSCYVAPTLYCWLRIANSIWPKNNINSAITKAVVEQITYTPFAMTSFYFGMTLLEGKGIEEAKKEVQAKFLPTYKIGACVWPVLQTFNYTVIRERNRVVFVSFCSLMWTSFLAYMKQLEHRELLGETTTDDTTTTPVKPVSHFINNETSQENTWVISRQLDR